MEFDPVVWQRRRVNGGDDNEARKVIIFRKVNDAMEKQSIDGRLAKSKWMNLMNAIMYKLMLSKLFVRFYPENYQHWFCGLDAANPKTLLIVSSFRDNYLSFGRGQTIIVPIVPFRVITSDDSRLAVDLDDILQIVQLIIEHF